MRNRQDAPSDVEWLEEFVGMAQDQLTEEDVSTAREILEEMGDGVLDSREYNAVSDAERWIAGYASQKNHRAAAERAQRMRDHAAMMKALQTMAECAELVIGTNAPLVVPFELPAETPETLREMSGRGLDSLANRVATEATRAEGTIAALESQRATLGTALAGEVRKRALDAIDATLSAHREALERCKALSAGIAAECARRAEERAALESVSDVSATLIDLTRRVASLEGAG